MTATNIGSNEQRGSEMPTERGSSPRLSLDTLDSLVGGNRRCHTAHRHADMKRDGWKCCINCGINLYAANAESEGLT